MISHFFYTVVGATLFALWIGFISIVLQAALIMYNIGILELLGAVVFIGCSWLLGMGLKHSEKKDD